MNHSQLDCVFQVYLAFLLRDLLSKTLKPRIVVVTSESHRFATLERLFELNTRDTFVSFLAYNNSKLLGLMFAIQANEEWYRFGIR